MKNRFTGNGNFCSNVLPVLIKIDREKLAIYGFTEGEDENEMKFLLSDSNSAQKMPLRKLERKKN